MTLLGADSIEMTKGGLQIIKYIIDTRADRGPQDPE